MARSFWLVFMVFQGGVMVFIVLIRDFTREVDGMKSSLWTSTGRWMARSLNWGLHQGGGWQEVLIVDFTREVDGKKS